MSREQMLYQIWFSHRLYSMSGVVLRRVDKTLSFLLLLLGSSVMGDIGWPQVTGFLIAALTALKMAFQFERSGEVATIQSRAWQNLYCAAGDISDEDLNEQIQNIQQNDPVAWRSLVAPAETETRNDLGEPVTTRLTLVERVVAFLAGART